jgi:xanthine dehydrogenase YagT iron-sulfur-binding subunit
MPPNEPREPPSAITRRSAIKQGLLLGTSLLVAPRRDFAQAAEDSARKALPVPKKVISVSFTLNGRPVSLEAEARTTLLDLLREGLALPGTKKGCDHGQCGACTVLVDGRRVLSCLTLAATVQAKDVVTIEGLAKDGQLHPIQSAFITHDAFQCGYCTPGQIMSTAGFLKEPWPATPEGIREGMSGNLCRCGAYCGIVAAIAEARDALKSRGS